VPDANHQVIGITNGFSKEVLRQAIYQADVANFEAIGDNGHTPM